jgi:hypothetical protein
MSSFAQVKDGIVINVIVADQDFIDTLEDKNSWIETNSASVGFTYDVELNAFIPPKTYNSWILNKDTFQWEPPVPYPTDGKYYTWNDNQRIWEEVIIYDN